MELLSVSGKLSVKIEWLVVLLRRHRQPWGAAFPYKTYAKCLEILKLLKNNMYV
jgi:hypothetical protein